MPAYTVADLKLSHEIGFWRLSAGVNNLFDKLPPKDATYTAYPYYDTSWFDSVGRSVYFNVTYKFGANTP